MALIGMFVPAGKMSIKCPYNMIPQGVVVHNTENDASALAEISYMIGNNDYTSYHYAVDDINIVQGISENLNAFHCGATYGNRNLLSIEICYSKSGGPRFMAAEVNAARLVADMCKRYGWGIDKVQTHKQQSGKECPRRTLALGWDRFLKIVQGFLNGNNTSGGGKVAKRQFRPGLAYVTKNTRIYTSTEWNKKVVDVVVGNQVRVIDSGTDAVEVKCTKGDITHSGFMKCEYLLPLYAKGDRAKLLEPITIPAGTEIISLDSGATGIIANTIKGVKFDCKKLQKIY